MNLLHGNNRQWTLAAMTAGFLVLMASVDSVYAQSVIADSVYFREYVYHQDGTACKHSYPSASFMVFLNRDSSRCLFDNAPRWAAGADPNFDGRGSYGLELANFANPGPAAGDSLFVIFTCSQTGQQAVSARRIAGIPWIYFPTSLRLASASVPAQAANVVLSVDSAKVRTLQWTVMPGVQYSIYRRTLRDTAGDRPRKMYVRIAENIGTALYIDTSARKQDLYGYIIVARNAAGVCGPHSEEVSEAPVLAPGDDIDLAFIARLPRISYVWNSANPTREGWPAVGQKVTWQAAIRNRFKKNQPDVQYCWFLDGVPVDSGRVTMNADATTTLNLEWTWAFERHVIRCVIDPNNEIPEEEEGNNDVSVITDALAVGFYVEQSLYNYFLQHQKALKVHSNSWEDWAQRHIKRWNQMFSSAVYPESPSGVLDRVRLDNVTIVPDGALPLVSGWLPTNAPNANDRTIDLQWGFTAGGTTSGFYGNHTSVSDNNPFYFEGSLLHELGHARYVVDVYGFNVHDDGAGSGISIRENGVLATSLGLIPQNYYTTMTGLMNSQYTYVDRYTAAAMNLIAGRRAVAGNYNAPNNIGIYMNDLPVKNRLVVQDAAGNPLSYASVKVFTAGPKSGDWYGKYYDNIPELILTADSAGAVQLGICPFSQDDYITHTYGLSNAVLIIRAEQAGRIGYGFLESFWFNLQYWSGHQPQGEYALRLEMKTLSGVAAADNGPSEFGLAPNYPNPFNPSTTIRYSVRHAGRVRLEVFDMLGRSIDVLLDKFCPPGMYTVAWNARQRPSGLYICRMTAGSSSSMIKMTLVK